MSSVFSFQDKSDEEKNKDAEAEREKEARLMSTVVWVFCVIHSSASPVGVQGVCVVSDDKSETRTVPRPLGIG